MEKQTAGRSQLGDLAPQFAAFNDDVLFGEVWSRVDELSARDRSLITVATLIGSGILDNSLKYHLSNARRQGVTKTEMVAAITQIAFYVGWPKAWAVFPAVREVYAEDQGAAFDSLFGLGEPNDRFAPYFVGRSYVKPLHTAGVGLFNVTFEPGCRNNWHIHHGGGQVLLCTDGQGWYQEWGQPARALGPGDVVSIPPGVRHWHGATQERWFTHVAIEIPSPDARNEWLDPVDEATYQGLGHQGYPGPRTPGRSRS